jgi:hypothetical protein
MKRPDNIQGCENASGQTTELLSTLTNLQYAETGRIFAYIAVLPILTILVLFLC